MGRYDIAIIGTGPAGLEAAITAKIRNKNILLFGSKSLSPKVEKAHMIKNYLGLPEISGEEMQKRFLEHLSAMDVQITEEKINTVYSMGNYFALQGQGNMYEADSVILSCGVSAAKPFPGELENLGRGVSYCATCDANLYKEKRTIVVGYSPEEEKEADFLADAAKEVVYLKMYKESSNLSGKVMVREGLNPVSIEKDENSIILNLEDESLKTDGIFILRDSVAPSQLVPGLKIENNQVVVDRNMKTNISGLFACGDITGAPYQYIKAAGEGNVAALSAVNFLAEKQ